MPILTYLEKQDNISPSVMTVSHDAASTSAPYHLELTSATPNGRYTELQNVIADVLGITGTRKTDGRIQRRMPLRHPIVSWMYADAVTLRGIGSKCDMISVSQGKGTALINSQVPVYRTYDVQIPCSKRNWNMWQDKDISVLDSTFYDKGGVQQNFKYATEWYRLTEWIEQPATQFITAQQGQMKYRVPGGDPPNNYTYQDAPKLLLPDSAVTVTWYRLPYRYVTSPRSYLRRFTGHVNQNGISNGPTTGGDDPQYPPGSLLYHGFTPLKIYPNPVPDEGLLGFNFGDGFNKARLCDVRLTFSFTARRANGDVPTPTNLSWVYSGWNLFPWMTDRKYYLATSSSGALDLPNTWVPMLPSFPTELFFTDPDLDQPFGEIDP